MNEKNYTNFNEKEYREKNGKDILYMYFCFCKIKKDENVFLFYCNMPTITI